MIARRRIELLVVLVIGFVLGVFAVSVGIVPLIRYF